jgi:hypothetical protein
MKIFSLCWIAMVSLMFTSCKEDEETKQKIADLETTIASLESDKISLQADNISLKANQAGLNEAAAKALTERKDQLEKEVQRLLPLETQIADLNKQIEELKTKLAAATMTPTSGTSNASGGNAGAEISKAVESSFVSIEGDIHRGGGFLAVDGEKVYLYTAASVLSGNQKLTIRTSGGQALTKFGSLELCEGLDIARMQVLDEVSNKMELVTSGSEIPASVPSLALGMAKGSTVVGVEKANVVGVEGQALTLDNAYLQSAPGGPVIHAISGKVLGVIGKIIAAPTGLWQTNDASGQPQQFVVRLNQSLAWKETKIGTFIAESKRLREFDDVTRLALAVTSVQLSENVPQFDAIINGSNATVQSVFDLNKEKSMVQSFEKWKGDGSGKKLVMSEADVKKKWRGLLGEGLSMAQKGVAEMNPAQFTWYHRAWAESSISERKDAVEDLNDKIAEAK